MSNSTKKRQIVAVGGKLLMPRAEHLIEQYVLQATNVVRPKVCFIPTATGDDIGYINRFYQVYSALDAYPMHLSLFTRTLQNLREFLLAADVIHVGGGNTRSMLAVWRHWGVDAILREAWENGIVLTGSSAGMLCWFTSGITDSIDGPLTTTDGLGFISGSACPHFNGEVNRRPSYYAMIASGELPAGYAADDSAGLHFIGNDLHAVIASEKDAAAYHIERIDGSSKETVLPARLLS